MIGLTLVRQQFGKQQTFATCSAVCLSQVCLALFGRFATKHSRLLCFQLAAETCATLVSSLSAPAHVRTVRRNAERVLSDHCGSNAGQSALCEAQALSARTRTQTERMRGSARGRSNV